MHADRSTGCATAAATAEAECRLGPAASRNTLLCSNERRGCAMCCVLRTVCYSLCATAPPVPSRLLQACVQHHHCRRLSLGSPPFQVFALLLLLLLLQEEEEEVETTCSSGTVGQLPSAQQQQGAPGQRGAADSAAGCSRQRSLKLAARSSHLCSALT